MRTLQDLVCGHAVRLAALTTEAQEPTGTGMSFTRLWIPGPGGVISGTTISDYFLNSLVMLSVYSHPPDYFNVWKGLKLSEKMEILLLMPSWLIYTEVQLLNSLS